MKKHLLLILTLALCTFFANAQNEPVGHWAFDDSDGETVEDLSGNDNFGTFFSGAEVSDDTPSGTGSSVELTGTGGMVDLGDPDILNIEGDITISFWTKFLAASNTANQCNIISKGHNTDPAGEVVVRMSANGIEWNCWNGAGESIPTPFIWEDEWIHVVCLAEAESYKIYVNGEFMAEKSDGTHGAVFAAAPWGIGGQTVYESDYATVARPFLGFVDDLQIFDVAISEDEIAALYDGMGEIVVVDPVGVNELSSNNLKVYPSIVTSGFINIKDMVNTNSTINIYNLNGQKVLSAKMNSNNERLNVDQLAKGMYLVSVQSQNGASLNQKITIQ